MMRRIFTAAAVVATLTLSAAASHAVVAQPRRGPIEIVVWNIRKGIGHVHVSICTRTTFINLHRDCPYAAEAPAQIGMTTVIVPDVPAGSYAAQVFHDEYDEHKVRRGLVGQPLEGVGFSNDASVPLSGPRFDEATFNYDPALPITLRIKLRYFPHL